MKNNKQLNDILQLLTEECAEVIQAISKVKRFGLTSKYKKGKTKKQELQQEIGDVVALVMILMAKHPEILNELDLSLAIKKKIQKLKKYHNFLSDLQLEKINES
jgi:NTP pyrophosphatase (non-canonical NTP hydrolase)